jgi:FtsP/CotA-like multicopper oxidase with cupredoxin domain
MIIVEDEPGSLPPEIVAMPEVQFILQEIDQVLVQGLQSIFNLALNQVQGNPVTLLLVNGQTQPNINLDQGRWYRFRMVYAAIQHAIVLSIPDNGAVSCDLELIAKDSIYLPTAPRSITSIPLYPASRADVAIRCTGQGTVSMIAGPGLTEPTNINAVVMTFSVCGKNVAQPNLPSFSVFRPCYLVNTRTSIPDQIYNFNLPVNGLTINGQSFVSHDTYLNANKPFLTGQLIESTINGLGVHIFHMHVNPFQIVSINNPGDPVFYQVGDWHDTFHETAGTVRVRFFVDKFTGAAVIHCHVLVHEDLGMMTSVLLAGRSGAVFPNAKKIDPVCFNGAGGRGFKYL